MAISADKVVVIPIGGSASAAANAIYGGGRIGSDGIIDSSYGKNFTSSKTAVGVYKVTMPGYGCVTADKSWPSIIASRNSGIGFIHAYPSECVSNANLDLYVRVYNTAGALLDGSFNFVIFETQPPASAAGLASLPDGTRDLGDCLIAPGSDAETCP